MNKINLTRIETHLDHEPAGGEDPETHGYALDMLDWIKSMYPMIEALRTEALRVDAEASLDPFEVELGNYVQDLFERIEV